MELISETETYALTLEGVKKETTAENLREIISMILSKSFGEKRQGNLIKAQIKSLSKLKTGKDIPYFSILMKYSVT